jgi:hypothetical protein
MRVAMLVGICMTAPILGQAGNSQGVERVAWLQGCWTAESADRVVEEHWMPPRGGSMLGVGRTVTNGQLSEYEFVVLRERGVDLVYAAHPSGQSPTEFMSTMVSSTRVVFENQAHEFPQVIGYERQGAILLAWAEGRAGGKTRRLDFAYRRTVCERE